MNYVKRFFRFMIRLGFEAKNNELYYMGNELTYKIFLSLFPFLVFIISLISYLNIDTLSLVYTFQGALPEQVLTTIVSFIDVINEQNTSSGIISISLGLAIISTSSGVISIMRGINRTYGITKKRNFLLNRIISVLLVFVLVLSLLVTFVLLIFSDSILEFISSLKIIDSTAILSNNTQFLYNILKYAITTVTVLFTTMIIYNVSVVGRLPFFSTLPGSIFTMVLWIVSSSAYNYYVNNYSRYSSIYGNIGNLFILVFWINIIAIIILVGSQINAILYKDNLARKRINE